MTTTDNMVQRVSQAIEAAWDEAANDEDAFYDTETLARAAIAAMREPTDAMVERGLDFAGRAGDAWRIMIDAALADK